MIQDAFKYSNEVDVMSILKYWSVDFLLYADYATVCVNNMFCRFCVCSLHRMTG